MPFYGRARRRLTLANSKLGRSLEAHPSRQHKQRALGPRSQEKIRSQGNSSDALTQGFLEAPPPVVASVPESFGQGFKGRNGN